MRREDWISRLKRDFGWNRTQIDRIQGARTWCGYGSSAQLVEIGALTTCE